MRVWDVHPGYLSRQSLLGQHAEIHAIFSVISGGREGYSKHPETLRWANNLDALVSWHDLNVMEMTLRGFNHASPIQFSGYTELNRGELNYVDSPTLQFELLRQKYTQRDQRGRIPLPKNSSEFWSHYKYSVMARGYRYYQEIRQLLNRRKDYPIDQDDELVGQVFGYMVKMPTEKSVRNVVDHLWGYFKDLSPEERADFGAVRQKDPRTQLHYLFGLAQEHKQHYLLHSTIFADWL